VSPRKCNLLNTDEQPKEVISKMRPRNTKKHLFTMIVLPHLKNSIVKKQRPQITITITINAGY